jgi:hypothetical protein
MGYIKEPEGIDFIIKSKSLTEEEDRAICEYIKVDKAKNKKPVEQAFSGAHSFFPAAQKGN